MRVCSKVAKPDEMGTAELKKIMRYLNATSSVGLPIHKGGELVAFVDSDWAGDVTDRRSVTGYVIGYSSDEGRFSPIIWRSVKQTCVATSSSEAKYVAMHDVCKEVAYLRNILKELGWLAGGPTVVYGDNASAIAIGNDTCTKAKHKREGNAPPGLLGSNASKGGSRVFLVWISEGGDQEFVFPD